MNPLRTRSRRRRSTHKGSNADIFAENNASDKVASQLSQISSTSPQITSPISSPPQISSTSPQISTVLPTTTSTIRSSSKSKTAYKKAISLIDDPIICKDIINTSTSSIITINKDGYIIYNNPATERMFEYAPNTLLGRKINILIPAPHDALHSSYLKIYNHNAENIRQIGDENCSTYPTHTPYHNAVKSDGSELAICMSIYIYPENGYITTIIRDLVSINPTNEMQAISIEDKNLFITNISHEFRTPLNSIINMVYLQSLDLGELEKALSNIQFNSPSLKSTSNMQLSTVDIGNINKRLYDIKDSNEIICRNCTTLSTQINDILDYSKLNSNKVSLRKKIFSLRECVDGCVDTLSSLIKEKKLEFVFSVDPELPELFVGDDERVNQIMMNLITNAIKFTDRGTISLVITKQKKSPPTKPSRGVRDISTDSYIDLLFKVIDTGIGIAELDQKKLFNSFTQLQSAKYRATHGSGLGLAICKKLCILMEGSIWIESSEVGVGTTFVAKIKLEVAKISNKKPQLDIIQLVNRRVLIVDDNDNNLITLSQYTFDWNMRPTTTNSYKIALMYIKNNIHFDIAIIDYYILKSTGVELAQDIRKLGGNFPMILVTSKSGHVDKEGLFADIIDKPIHKEKLLRSIYFALTTHHQSHLQSRPQTISTSPNNIQSSSNTSVRSRSFGGNDKINNNPTRVSRDDINLKSSIQLRRSASFSNYTSDSESIPITKSNNILSGLTTDTFLSAHSSVSTTASYENCDYEILIAEDNIDHQKVLYRLLAYLGFTKIDVFATCIQAFHAMNTKKYNIAFIDINMPEVSGLQLIEMIKQDMPSSQHPKLIAVTAVSSFGDGTYYTEQAGFDYYISKPINHKTLNEVLDKIINSTAN